MKNVRMAIASLMLALCLVVAGSNGAKAQTGNTNVDAALNQLSTQFGLVNANVLVGAVVVDDVITIGDVTVTDVVDINDVLNNSLNNIEIRVLTDFLNGANLLNDSLNNLLRDADIIKNNQVVVGLLSSGQLVVAQAAPGRMK